MKKALLKKNHKGYKWYLKAEDTTYVDIDGLKETLSDSSLHRSSQPAKLVVGDELQEPIAYGA